MLQAVFVDSRDEDDYKTGSFSGGLRRVGCNLNMTFFFLKAIFLVNPIIYSFCIDSR